MKSANSPPGSFINASARLSYYLKGPFCWLVLGIGLVTPGLSSAGEQLVRNPDFSVRSDDGQPAEWELWQPGFRENACRVRATAEGVVVDAPGKPYAVGGLTQTIRGIRAGQAYKVSAQCQVNNIASVYRSLMIRLTWLTGQKPVHPAGILIRGPFLKGNIAAFEDVVVAPEGADQAIVSLEVKWPGDGSVIWKFVNIEPTDPPPPRRVKVGTVHFRARNSTPEKNLELYSQFILEAGRLGLDIVCLPELITVVGTNKKSFEVAQPIPGPDTDYLGRAAREARVWVVAGLAEKDGPNIYNTAVLLNREGQVAGKYRKVHLPREEWKEGITPGTDYPVFQTDFGRVAIQICYDWFFPESHANFALRGAEIIFAPTWGETFPDSEGRVHGENVFRVRARDNCVFLVASVYDGSSMIIDPMGRILVSNQGKEGLFWCEIDLAQREPWWWVGYWRAIGPRDRMPGTYKMLTEEPRGPTY
ncbi:MAG: carbon-nitrogen hydrolase family protein [Thermoguttaceae bacterium]|nr:carbon-nitrogen hydrolase family protein [Thermoguttaceae bacterium]MDW8078594.1 carbon-nitrogen hydrolase family protein [Thermoguttaceae bacterium]